MIYSFLHLYRFLEEIATIPRFHCTKRCKAPNSFYSGAPILSNPESGTLTIEDDTTSNLEWQIWTSILKTDDLVITINGKVINHSQRGTKDGLTFWMEPDGIQFLGKFMKVGMNIQIESDSEMTAWKIELKNAKGGIVIFYIHYSMSMTL